MNGLSCYRTEGILKGVQAPLVRKASLDEQKIVSNEGILRLMILTLATKC